MCFSSPSAPQPQINRPSYSLDTSESAVEQTVTAATPEEMPKGPEAPPATPVRTAKTGIYFKQG